MLGGGRSGGAHGAPPELAVSWRGAVPSCTETHHGRRDRWCTVPLCCSRRRWARRQRRPQRQEGLQGQRGGRYEGLRPPLGRGRQWNARGRQAAELSPYYTSPGGQLQDGRLTEAADSSGRCQPSFDGAVPAPRGTVCGDYAVNSIDPYTQPYKPRRFVGNGCRCCTATTSEICCPSTTCPGPGTSRAGTTPRATTAGIPNTRWALAGPPDPPVPARARAPTPFARARHSPTAWVRTSRCTTYLSATSPTTPTEPGQQGVPNTCRRSEVPSERCTPRRPSRRQLRQAGGVRRAPRRQRVRGQRPSGQAHQGGGERAQRQEHDGHRDL